MNEYLDCNTYLTCAWVMIALLSWIAFGMVHVYARLGEILSELKKGKRP